MRQPDLFAPEPEPDLFGEERLPVQFRADPDKVRAKLHRVLAEAKAASVMPWSRDDLRFHQTVFPQMCNWLPDEEAAQLRFEFDTELKRLLAA